jgi:ATP-binding cassette subfamily B (MDR/TAP) protein 1
MIGCRQRRVFCDWLLQATGVRLGMVFQSLASIGVGIIIGLIYSWKLALFIIALAPLFLVAGFLEMQLMKGFSGGDSKAMEEAGKVNEI